MTHAGETQQTGSLLHSQKVKSPQENTQSKIPTPTSHIIYFSSSQPVYTPPNHGNTINSSQPISSSQPVNTSSTLLRKRQLSTSPQNSVSQTTRKNAKVGNTFFRIRDNFLVYI